MTLPAHRRLSTNACWIHYPSNIDRETLWRQPQASRRHITNVKTAVPHRSAPLGVESTELADEVTPPGFLPLDFVLDAQQESTGQSGIGVVWAASFWAGCDLATDQSTTTLFSNRKLLKIFLLSRVVNAKQCAEGP